MAYPTPDVWYRFENDIVDFSGNGNDGTPVGTPTYSTSKENLGQCKGPEVGQGNYYNSVDIGISGDGLWSFAMWLSLNTWPGNGGYIFGFGTNAAAQRVDLYYNDPNSLRVVHGDSNPLLEFEGSTGNFPENTWFHLALVYDTSLNVVKYYINGVPEDTYARANLGINYTYHGVTHVPQEPTRNYLGKIDNYMAWAGVALTDEQVAEIYAITNQLRVNSHLFGPGSAAEVAALIEITLEGIDDSKSIHTLEFVQPVRSTDQVEAVLIIDA